MLHAKFQDHRTSGSGKDVLFLKVFTLYWPGAHQGHVTVTWNIYITFCPPFPRRLHKKIGFDWQSGFSGEDV